MNQNTPQTPLQAGLAAVAAMDATPECLEAIARVADPATQMILDLQEKVRALTLVAEDAKALAKGAAQMRYVLEHVRPLVKRAILDNSAYTEEEAIQVTWLGHLDQVLAETAPKHTP